MGDTEEEEETSPPNPSQHILQLRDEKNQLEEEVRRLERELRMEKEEQRRRRQENEQERELENDEAEKRWMEHLRSVRDERDQLKESLITLEEQLEAASVEVNRLVAYRMEQDEAKTALQRQFDGLLRDYEETMLERSTVLEENARLAEERDRLRVSIKQLSAALSESSEGKEIQILSSKLENTRRLLYLSMQEKAAVTNGKNSTLEELKELRLRLEEALLERDEALRLLEGGEQQPAIVDNWSTHTIQIAVPHPRGNLGIVLNGGKSDDSHVTPIYVKDVLVGSPLESHLRRFDHIVMVNDIDVSVMDQRAVIDILRHSHHLKMVIRRRTTMHRTVELTLRGNSDIGVEFSNGVFVNKLDKNGLAERCGLRLGNRLVFVNNVPTFDAKHAEEILRNSTGNVSLGILSGGHKNHSDSISLAKQKTLFSKMHEKLFRRTEKPRNVVARANIDQSSTDLFFRHGSLRMPSHSLTHQLIRTASLRAPHGSIDHKKIIDQLDQYLHKNERMAAVVASDMGSTWPKLKEVEGEEGERLVRKKNNRPSVFPVFATTPEGTRCLCSTPLPPPPSTVASHATSSPLHFNHRVSTYSPALPQPPPYPGPRYGEESMSSILSSTSSVPHPSTSSTTNNYNANNNSPSDTLLSETEMGVRRVCLSKDEGEFGVGLEDGIRGGVIVGNVHGRANGVVQRGERILDIGGINMRSADKSAAARVLSHFHASQDEVTMVVAAHRVSRWVSVPRKEVNLCGGNAIGIMAETGIGELLIGDRILELDGADLRSATLEDALTALNTGTGEMVDMLVESGGDGVDRLRAGADGDGFYVRINIDRAGETGDELDVKQGEIVYVDNTVFMGQRGRWRAWRVDREGRQRQCGIIPSACVVEAVEARARKSGKGTRQTICRPVYERVERVSSDRRRPVLLFGALIAPFAQGLIDDATVKFSQCVPECRSLSPAEVDRLLSSGQIIDARRRDKLFDVISTSSLFSVMDQGLHCILDVSPAAIPRLHALRIYPIVINIKFKSSKQIKELKEEGGDKKTAKQAKELLERSVVVEGHLESMDCVLATVVVGAHTPVKQLVRHICQQIIAQVDHEQKKSVWIAAH